MRSMSARITALDPLPSDPNLLRVRVGGRVVARLTRADAERLQLEVGQAWTEDLSARVQQVIDTVKARKAALAMLSRRALSCGEMAERLEKRGHEQAIVHTLVNQLTNDGWLDDRAYARTIVYEVLRKKPAAKMLLVQKLQVRKIDSELALEVAEEALGETDQVAAAEQFAIQRMESMKGLSKTTVVRRIAAQLARRGFDQETIEQVMSRLGLQTEPGLELAD